MASPTQWKWVWVNSRSEWWTGRPGVLRFMGSQRFGHDWATELNWLIHIYIFSAFYVLGILYTLSYSLFFFSYKNFIWERERKGIEDRRRLGTIKRLSVVAKVWPVDLGAGESLGSPLFNPNIYYFQSTTNAFLAADFSLPPVKYKK